MPGQRPQLRNIECKHTRWHQLQTEAGRGEITYALQVAGRIPPQC